MTPDQVALVLTKAAAIDQRTIGAADVMAWHEILERVAFDDATEAVRRHYAASRDRIMPADVLRIARVVRDDRHRGSSEPLAIGAASPFEPDVSRSIRIERGLATCKPVLDAIASRLAAQREPEAEMSESDLRRQRARQRAAAERRANRVRGVA